MFKLSEQVNYDNLVLNYQDKNKKGKTFNDFSDVINLYEKVQKSDIDLEKVSENQEQFKLELKKMKKVKHKSEKQ